MKIKVYVLKRVGFVLCYCVVVWNFFVVLRARIYMNRNCKRVLAVFWDIFLCMCFVFAVCFRLMGIVSVVTIDRL